MKISLNSPMRQNLLSLQQTARLYDTSSLRLATGLKVNSALDSPSAFYTAASLNGRAADLSSLLDAMTQGVQTLKAASQTIEALNTLLQQTHALASMAAGDIKELPPPEKGNITKSWLMANGVDEKDIITTKEQLDERLKSAQAGDRLVIFATIDMGNDGIVLKDGVSLTGAEAIIREAGEEKNMTVAKSNQARIDFNFTATDKAIGIDLGNTSNLSDLEINYFSQNKGGADKFVAINNSSGTSALTNINLKVDGGTGSGSVSGILNNNTLKISGTTNIETTSSTGLMAVNNTLSKGKLIQETNSVLNIKNLSNQTAVNVGELVSYGEININSVSSAMIVYSMQQFGTINIYTHGTSAYGISVGSTADIHGTLNILTTGNLSTAYRPHMSSYQNTNVYGSMNIKVQGQWARAISAQISAKSSSQVHMYNGQNQYEGALYYEAGAIISMTNSKSSTVWQATVDGSAPKANYNTLDGIAGLTALGQAAPAFPDILSHITDAWDKREEQKGLKSELILLDASDDDTGPQYEMSRDFDADFQKLLGQYNGLLADSSYKGINLLTGDNLTVIFNEDRTSSLNIQGYRLDANSLGLTAIALKTPENINEAIGSLEAAINSLRSVSIELGNNYNIVTTRSQFTENIIAILNEGADKLTLADMNEESANSLMLDTRRQLGINALSLASQASKTVLRLF